MNSASSANLTIASKRSESWRRDRPSRVPLRKMFSRPVSSGWKAAPNSSRGATRPRTRARPAVGRSTRATTLSSVLLPAPFRPMSPKTSPSSTVMLTSRSAQNSSWWRDRLTIRSVYSFSVAMRSRGIRKRTDTPSSAMAGSDTIRELVRPGGEDEPSERQSAEGPERAGEDGHRLGPHAVVERAPEQHDQTVERVDVHQPGARPVGQDVRGIDDRRQVQEHGQEELVELADVREVDRQRREEEPDPEGESCQQEERDGHEQGRGPGPEPAEHDHQHERDQGQDEVHQAGEHGRHREERARDVDFVKQSRTPDELPHRRERALGEEIPRKETAQQIRRVGGPCPEDLGEDDGQYQRGGEWVEHRPRHAQE